MELREAFDYPLSRLDPFGAHIDPPSVAVYETLVVKGPDGKAHPGLADSWEISDDKMEWRFRLRSGARFHSGDRCDAQAVLAALESLRWGFHGGRQLWYWDPVDTVTVIDSETLLFRLHYPYMRLPSLLWGTHTAIHNERCREADPEGSGIEWADGTGPFRLETYSPDRVEVKRWDDYPGSRAGFLQINGNTPLDRIVWTKILDPEDRVSALEEGVVHAIHGPDYSDVERLENDERFNVVRFSQAANAYLAPNWKQGDLGFDDLCIRRAMSLALDRDALVRDALLGYGAGTFGPISVDGEFYDASVEHGRGRDLRKASDLLDEAGWHLGTSGIRERNGQKFQFECVIQDDTIHRRIAEGMRDHLKQVGIQVQLRPVLTFRGFYDACSQGPDSFINKWLWQDPVDAALGFTATWGQPHPNWQYASIPDLDDAYRTWLAAGSNNELQDAASVVQRIAADQLPYIPLVVPQDVWVHTVNVKAWTPAQSILYPFYHRTRLSDQG